MVSFGEILTAIGDFGLFQKLIAFGLSAPTLLMPIYFSSFLFVQSNPEGHCNTNWILRADPNLTTGEQLNLTVPREQDGTFSKCRMFVPVKWDINAIRQYGLNETTGCQNGWKYYNTVYEATIVTDFDLVCDKSYMIGLSQTVMMTGLVCGSLIFGPLAESYGRRKTTQLTAVVTFIFVIIVGLSPNLYIYMVALFIVGAAIGGYRVTATVLGTEWTGVARRSVVSCLSQMFGGVGQCFNVVLVYFIRDWRIAQYIMASLQAVVFVYIWWIPESARWLFGQGRTQEANTVIRKVAAINKKKIPDNLPEQVTEQRNIRRGGVKALFASVVLARNFFILSFAWFSINLAYMCLVLNVGKFGLSIFLVQLLFGVFEIPAHLICIWVLELVGRKISLISTVLSGSAVCYLTLAFSQDNGVAITVLVTIGKFFFSWASSVCMVYVQELFPTSVRQTAVGLASTIFRLGGLVSPLLNMLARYHWSIPITIFSSITLVCAALSILLPETTRMELPDSSEETEGNENMSTKKSSEDSNMAHVTLSSTKL